MTTSLAPRRRRRAVVVAAGLALATIASAFGASPAGAATAPLTTTDGIGIRLDENAILGPALEAVEDALQPYVNQKIYEGALANSVMDNPDWVQGSANLELSFDFINAGTPGYAQGGIKVRGDLQNIMMRFYRYGEWWQPECQFRVNPDDGWIDASAYVDTSKLPAAPLTMNPINAYWDNDPAITREKGNWLCTGYLLDEWWDGLWGSGTDVAAQLEAELNGEAQGLINDLWAEHVAPVITSLNEFGITFSQVKTDDHGLIVKANTDASAGIAIPGLGGPYDVSTAEDSGATSNVDALLAARSEVTVSIHPNVVNQFMKALSQAMNNNVASPTLDAAAGVALESYLVAPAGRATFADAGWKVTVTATQGYHTEPTGPGGRPQVRYPVLRVTFFNSSYVFGVSPVAVFTANATGVGFGTEIRPSGSFGPYLSGAGMALSGATRVSAHAQVVAHNPDPNGILPYGQAAVDLFSDVFLTDFLSLAPISVGGIPVSLCTTCPRAAGDQRYTEYFNVG